MSAKRCFSCETSSLGLWLLPGFMQSLSNHFFHTKQTCELRTSASAPILDLRHKLAKVGFNLLTLFPIARLQVTDQPCLPSIGREAETNLRLTVDVSSLPSELQICQGACLIIWIPRPFHCRNVNLIATSDQSWLILSMTVPLLAAATFIAILIVIFNG